MKKSIENLNCYKTIYRWVFLIFAILTLTISISLIANNAEALDVNDGSITNNSTIELIYDGSQITGGPSKGNMVTGDILNLKNNSGSRMYVNYTEYEKSGTTDVPNGAILSSTASCDSEYEVSLNAGVITFIVQVPIEADYEAEFTESGLSGDVGPKNIEENEKLIINNKTSGPMKVVEIINGQEMPGVDYTTQPYEYVAPKGGATYELIYKDGIVYNNITTSILQYSYKDGKISGDFPLKGDLQIGQSINITNDSDKVITGYIYIDGKLIKEIEVGIGGAFNFDKSDKEYTYTLNADETSISINLISKNPGPEPQPDPNIEPEATTTAKTSDTSLPISMLLGIFLISFIGFRKSRKYIKKQF